MNLSPVPEVGERLGCAGAAGWRPGLASASFSEIFAAGDQGSGAGAALALALDAAGAAEDARSVLWVQDRGARRLGGRPYGPGVPFAWRRRLLHVAAATPDDALFALEEGLRCRELACVIGEIAGNPKALDFVASRRLSIVAERYGVPLFLVRLDAARDLSAARMRWQVTAAPSLPPRWNAQAPGDAAWRAELFRARAHPPGEWILRADFGAARGFVQEGLRDGLSTSGLGPSSGRSEVKRFARSS